MVVADTFSHCHKSACPGRRGKTNEFRVVLFRIGVQKII